MKRKVPGLLSMAASAAVVAAFLTGCSAVTQLKGEYNAAYGYEYGFPLVMMDLTRQVITATNQSGEYKAPINQFARMRTYVSPDFKDCVRISVNSLWSFSYLDLDQEPLIVTLPECKDRYIVVQALNMWTDNFAGAGTRKDGGKAGHYLVAGPKWNGRAPGDVTDVWRCNTRYAAVLVQMAAASPADFAAIHVLQDQLKITPLSSWGKAFTPPANVPVDPDVDVTATPFDQLAAMDGVAFFKALARSLKDNAPYPADAKMVKKLKKLGVEPGKDFDASKISKATKEGMDKGVAKVWGMLSTAGPQMKGPNGWLTVTDFGDFGTDYGNRAFLAYFGLGALCKEDALYPTAFRDGDGNLLDGQSRYVIHFEKDGVPPSQCGVWSVSPYRGNFYVRNELNRYGVLSSMPLKYNTDGSLDLYVQRDSPGADKESNWLPVPRSGPFNLTIRVYQPKKEIMDGKTKDNLIVEPSTYRIPPVKRVG